MPTVTTDVAIYYVERGPDDAAETLLFCHGAGGNAASWWQQLPEFARDYRCIAFDHRGFGRSPCAPEAFRIEAFADDALAVLDAADAERVHLVCQSMGGWTGVRLALAHPQRVASLTLADTIGGFALPSGLESMADMAERAATAGALTPALAADFHITDPNAAFLYEELSAFNMDLGVLGLGRKLTDPDVLLPVARAAELRLPVLVVSGRHDLIWPPAVLHELAGLFPDARIVELDAGHSAYFENPLAFNNALRTFLGPAA
jgi:3-oxoadipate enol-lactonase